MWQIGHTVQLWLVLGSVGWDHELYKGLGEGGGGGGGADCTACLVPWFQPYNNDSGFITTMISMWSKANLSEM